MLYLTEFPRVYSAGAVVLDIFSKPIQWFRPWLSGLGQVAQYRFAIKPLERSSARLFDRKLLRMSDGTELTVAVKSPPAYPRAVVLYLHTVCGNYTQMAHSAEWFNEEGFAYITYTRSGNDRSPKPRFTSFNFVGRVSELQSVVDYIGRIYPNVPIHAIGASAGSALLIRYLGSVNSRKRIKSAVLVSPGYDFIKSCNAMDRMTKAYLVNQMKFMLRNTQHRDDFASVRTLDDWMVAQSRVLGYPSTDAFVSDCNPLYYLKTVNVPTLCISAMDDSIFVGSITKQFLDLPQHNSNITIVTTERGGHVIFKDQGHEHSWFVRAAREWFLNHS